MVNNPDVLYFSLVCHLVLEVMVLEPLLLMPSKPDPVS